ncbi:hypothetical protein D3C73_1278400 [compost metagenome]
MVQRSFGFYQVILLSAEEGIALMNPLIFLNSSEINFAQRGDAAFEPLHFCLCGRYILRNRITLLCQLIA